MQELSARQKAILERIALALASSEPSPSIRELAQAAGLNSTSSVHHHLNILEEMGYIKRRAASVRAISLTPKAMDTVAPFSEDAEGQAPLFKAKKAMLEALLHLNFHRPEEAKQVLLAALEQP